MLRRKGGTGTVRRTSSPTKRTKVIARLRIVTEPGYLTPVFIDTHSRNQLIGILCTARTQSENLEERRWSSYHTGYLNNDEVGPSTLFLYTSTGLG